MRDEEKLNKLEQLRIKYNIDNVIFAMGIEASRWAAVMIQKSLYEKEKMMNPNTPDKEIFKKIIMSRTNKIIPYYGLDISEEEINKAVESMKSGDDLVRYILLKESEEPQLQQDPFHICEQLDEILFETK